MPCNCNALGCAEMFGDRIARKDAARFRRRGLEPRSRRLLEALAGRVPLSGKTAVEVGAGVGGLTISLLEKGVAHATIIDASPAYVETARTIAAERGVAGALTAGIGNYAEDVPGEPADIVVMDRAATLPGAGCWNERPRRPAPRSRSHTRATPRTIAWAPRSSTSSCDSAARPSGCSCTRRV